jgi:hypothetical protein
VRMTFNAKPREKINAFDMNTLLKNDFRREHGIQTAGNQSDRFTLLGHSGGTSS